MGFSAWSPAGRTIVVCVLLAATPSFAQMTFRVDDDNPPGGDGLSWPTAFNDLQDALAVAVDGDEIWVAEGTYKPSVETVPGDPRSVSFALVAGVSIYGGFANGEMNLEQRAGFFETTILSGDLLGDDQPGFLNYGENAYHVLRATGSAGLYVIDGLHVTAGNATGSSIGAGSALYAQTGPVEVRNSVFTVNHGDFAVEFATGVPGPGTMIIDCEFRENVRGATSAPPIDVIDSLFINNNALGFGSGAASFVKDCDFIFTSGLGLGLKGSARAENCRFIGNGIGLQLNDTGGAFNTSAVNCLFSGNTGDAIHLAGNLVSGSTAWIFGCTFRANGRGLVANTWITGTIRSRDCIFWENVGSDFAVIGPSGAEVLFFSSILPGWNDPWAGCCSDSDPLFVDPDGPDNTPGTLDDNLRLSEGSPAIDAGYCLGGTCCTGPSCPPPDTMFDLDGNPRYLDGNGDLVFNRDLGPYEFTQTPNIGLSTWEQDGSGFFNDGTNWSGGVPGAFNDAVFDDGTGALPGYGVIFSDNATTWSLTIESQRAINFQLSDKNYQVTGVDDNDMPSVVIGHLPNLDSRLELSNRFAGVSSGLSCTRASIADGPMSLGTLTVTGGFTFFDSMESLFVGREGVGVLEFEQGAQGTFIGEAISIATEAGSTGSLVLSGNADFSHAGFGTNARTNLTIGDSGDGALTIDSQAGSASLVGDTFIGDVTIAAGAGSTGTVSLSGPGAHWDAAGLNFYVGGGGDGSLTISGGATLATNMVVEIQLGRDAGSSGAVTVTGPGSSWIEQTAFLFIAGEGTSTMTVSDGGLIQAPNVVIGPSGILLGDATLTGSVISNGTISPGTPGPGGLGPPATGILTINGNYSQESTAPGQSENSGSLAIHLAGTAPGSGHDQLSVLGEATLGGGLFVTVDESFDPQLGQSFTLLNATSFVKTFDVVATPGLGDGRFLTVEYDAGAALGTQVATIGVENLATLFGLDDTNTVDVAGVPTDVAVGDLDGDNMEDVAITLRGATPIDPGTVLILLNGGFDAQTGDWIVKGTVQVTVGAEPSGIALAFLDGDADLDIAVSNFGDDDVSVLINNGGAASFARTDFPVGTNPSDIAAADFVENDASPGDVDLLVANSGDNTLMILDNDGSDPPVFSLNVTLNTGFSPVSVDPSDLDNDKDADVVALNQNSSDIYVYVNDTMGIFAAPVILNVGETPVDLGVADFDENGFVDFVTANEGDGTVSVVLNNGDGTYQPAVDLAVGAVPRSLVPINLDADAQDTDFDLAVVVENDQGERVVKILRNDLGDNGQLIFADAVDLAAGEDPALVTRGDLDGDGNDDDLVTVNDSVGTAEGPAVAGGVMNTMNLKLGFETCLADCADGGDGMVGIVDFLSLLSQWGEVGTACDIDGGGVGITDFLALLADWGPCS